MIHRIKRFAKVYEHPYCHFTLIEATQNFIYRIFYITSRVWNTSRSGIEAWSPHAWKIIKAGLE
jgi:hypothetical protein